MFSIQFPLAHNAQCLMIYINEYNQCDVLYFRYNIRGLDEDGHAANFVETEQIIEYDYTKCSFVQVCLFITATSWLCHHS